MRTLFIGSFMIDAHKRHTKTIVRKLKEMLKRNDCECQEDSMFIPKKEWDEFRNFCIMS